MEPPEQLPDNLKALVENGNCKDYNHTQNILEGIESGDKGCLLKKSSHGLRQARRNWF